MSALFDSCILIDSLVGRDVARRELRRHPRRLISVVSWIEVMTGAGPSEERSTRAMLAGFEVIQTSPAIANLTVRLRGFGLKLPDAVILATAMAEDAVLVTRDARLLSIAAEHVATLKPYEI